jgi:2'-5' RNA ligase
MENKKFLTVMAVFDNETQKKLAQMQSKIIEQVGNGTQTMGIPFHLTLGSYPTEKQDELVFRIKEIASSTTSFEVSLIRYNTFSDKVLFLEPTVPQELLRLRGCFECDYANGYDWVPHATLFCGEAVEIQRAKGLLPQISEPMNTRIVGIELGEFFPPKKIIRKDFQR